MANEQLYSNFITLSEVLAAEISEAFVNKSIGLGLVHSEVLPDNTNTMEFRRAGTTKAKTVAELAAFVRDADTEITDSSVTATAEKKVAQTEHSVESLEFGTAQAQLPRFAQEHGRALGELYDDDLKALFSSVTNTTPPAGTVTPGELMTARYNIEASMKGALPPLLVAMLGHKGLDELRQDLIGTTASPYVSQVELGVLGIPQTNGFAGTLFDVAIYGTSGLPTDTGDDVGCVWAPNYAFASALKAATAPKSDIAFKHDTLSFEYTTYAFWKTVVWNDTAACAVRSAS